tara:strand:- start:301 stop:606 length:306 start_codon:yes stop_codon:yes gene_type:complete
MKARIYQPAKTAMQSGRGKTHQWILEYEPTRRQQLDPMMGWPGAGDTRQQVRLKFDTLEEATAFARKNGIEYQVQTPKQRSIKPKAYADNFAYGRKVPWSH